MKTVVDAKKMKRLSVNVPDGLHQALKIHAARVRREMSEIVTELLQKHLAVVEGKVKP